MAGADDKRDKWFINDYKGKGEIKEKDLNSFKNLIWGRIFKRKRIDVFRF